MAFNKGARKCIDINLVHAELYMIIAAVARYQMELFETEKGGSLTFLHAYHIAFFPG